jgi:hypothetical protein
VSSKPGAGQFTEQTYDGVPQRIDEAIRAADLVLILGFGFHQQNMDLLKPGLGAATRAYPRSIIASMFGIDDESTQHLLGSNLCQYLAGNAQSRLEYRPWKAADLFVRLRPMITNIAR